MLRSHSLTLRNAVADQFVKSYPLSAVAGWSPYHIIYKFFTFYDSDNFQLTLQFLGVKNDNKTHYSLNKIPNLTNSTLRPRISMSLLYTLMSLPDLPTLQTFSLRQTDGELIKSRIIYPPTSPSAHKVGKNVSYRRSAPFSLSILAAALGPEIVLTQPNHDNTHVWTIFWFIWTIFTLTFELLYVPEA